MASLSRFSGVSGCLLRCTPSPPCPPYTDTSSGNTHTATHAPDSLLSRLEAVDKFALYGRQHSHVDHLSGAEVDTMTALQSTILLQEDGQLAARLDDIVYLVDGLLGPVRTSRARLAQTRSVLELMQLLQDPQTLQAVALSSQRRSIQHKLKLLLLTLRDTTDEMSRLSLAVLVYFLSKSADTEDYFDDQVLAATIHALKQEQTEKQTGQQRAEVSDAASMKKCLKRKQNTQKLAEDATLETSTTQVLDAFCRLQLDEMLQDHEVFYAGDELQVSVLSALCAALHNLLQVDGPSSSSTSLSGDAAELAFQQIRARKRQLMRNGGLAVLALDLVQQVDSLEKLLPTAQHYEVTGDCARSLHHINMVLRVFDQATFLTVDVQQYVSRERSFFAVLLELTQLLSELCWGVEAQRRCDTELSRMTLAVETLLATLRVLLNLTHHNVEAAGHVHALDGMQRLVCAFDRLRGAGTAAETQKKWEFDSCLLLLSVMVNSIELSEENRDALAACHVGGDAVTSQAGCGLFVRFFLSKLESYQHFIDGAEGGDAGRAFSGQESDDWSPEDVILGGCMSLLVGYLMKGSTANSAAVLEAMPDGSPRLLLRALSVFVAFHSQIGALTPEVAKSVLVVEKVLEPCQDRALGTVERKLLDTIAVEALPCASEWQETEFIDAATDESSTMSLDSVGSQASEVSPLALRTQVKRNLCSTLDDSDDERLVQEKRSSQANGMRTPLRILGTKRPRRESAMSTQAGVVRARASNIAVLPGGSMSSPVVARLLKRTRQLVVEFDSEFGHRSQSRLAKKRREPEAAAFEKPPSPCMVFTIDVTCRDNSSAGLVLSLAVEEEKGTTSDADGEVIGLTATSSKRKTKLAREPRATATSATASIDFFPSSSLSSTPLPVKNGTALLQTPTRATRSPALFRPSPSLNLTPTKSSPSTPLRVKKTSDLLRTPTRTCQLAVVKDSPSSAGQRRRKAKALRAPSSTHASSIFDFLD